MWLVFLLLLVWVWRQHWISRQGRQLLRVPPCHHSMLRLGDARLCPAASLRCSELHTSLLPAPERQVQSRSRLNGEEVRLVAISKCNINLSLCDVSPPTVNSRHTSGGRAWRRFISAPSEACLGPTRTVTSLWSSSHRKLWCTRSTRPAGLERRVKMHRAVARCCCRE